MLQEHPTMDLFAMLFAAESSMKLDRPDRERLGLKQDVNVRLVTCDAVQGADLIARANSHQDELQLPELERDISVGRVSSQHRRSRRGS